jgi:hypothetical protein
MVQRIDGSWHVACIQLGWIHVDMDDIGVEHGWTKALIGVRLDIGLSCLEKMIAFTTLGRCNVRVLLNNLHNSVIWYVWFLPIQFFELIFLSFLHFIIAFVDDLYHHETIKENMAFFSIFSNMKFYRPILCLIPP